MSDFPQESLPTQASVNLPITAVQSLLGKLEAMGNLGYWSQESGDKPMYWSDQLVGLLSQKKDTQPSVAGLIEAVHPEDYSKIQQLHESLFENFSPFKSEFRLLLADGTVRHILAECWIEKANATEPQFFYGLWKDITQDKQLVYQDWKKLSLVLNTAPETIWCLDPQYRLIFGNDKFFESIHRLQGKPIQIGEHLLDEKFAHLEDFEFWKTHYDLGLKGEKTTFIQKRKIEQKNFYHQVQIVPIWEGGKVHAIACYSENVTQRVEEENKNKELLEKLNQSQRIGKLGYWEFDLESEKIFWSDEVFHIWGLDKEKVLPDFDLFTKSFVEEDLEGFLIEHFAAVQGYRPLDAVHRIRCSNHTIKYVHEKGQLEVDPETGQTKFKGTVQDITYQREIENKLRERNSFIEATLKNLPMGIAVNNMETGETTYINPAFSKVYGWPEEVLKDVSTFFEKVYPDPEFRAQITEKIMSDIQSGNPERMTWSEVPITNQNGETRFVTAKNIPLTEQNLMISTVLDETDRFRAEQSIRKSNERFHLATQAVSDAIWDWDMKSDQIFWGKGYHRLFGYPAHVEYVSPDFWNSKVHPEDLQRILDSIFSARKNTAQIRWTGEYRFQKFDGSYAFVKENTVIIRDSSGQPVRMVGALQDITEEKKNQLLLAKKTKFIEATAQVIELFLENEDWESQISPMLQVMGEAAEADRSYFIQIYRRDGATYGNLSHEWANQNIISYIDNPEYRAIPVENYPEFWQKAFQRKPYAVLTRETDKETRKILEEQEIKSILHIPVFLENEMLGYLGFDDCHEEHIWTEDEKNFMQSIATNLSFAIGRKQYLDQLQEAFETHDTLLESIGDSFYAFDKNYTVTYWNNTVEQLTGVKKEAILGKNLWDFIQVQNEDFKEGYRKAFEESKRVNFETFDPWTQTWLEVTIYPTKEGLSVILRNISTRKESEKQIQEFNERLSLISKASHDAIWDWNIVTGEHYWGEGFNLLFDEEVAGIHHNNERWEKSIHPEDKDQVIKNLIELLNDPSKTSFESEYRFYRKNKGLLYLLDKGTIIRDQEGKPTRLVGAIQDISRRKAYEESLKILNSELAKSNRELEISNKELEQFAYVASHDLQEPLRMISSFLTLIEKKYRETLDEKGKQYIRFAVDGAKRMREIILDLLEFSRVGNINESKKLVNLTELAQEAITLNKKSIQERQAQIHLSPLPEAPCHPNSLIQVFHNLISNAIKYQIPGNRPEISIDFMDKGEFWQLSIKDNGIGIGKEYLDKIFMIFQRLHQKEQYSGSGIGLSICKKIVEFHGGTIWAESDGEHGTTFFFTLKKQ
uniref:PAS domain-containing protein n=1 Tax=Algoriphagus sp. TaxID=1872435 RepID=UPI002587C1A3|nr:PAS domain-containing protein [Algoriphagus sp.]